MPSTNDFSQRCDEARRLVSEADCLLVGAGAGLSAAAGLLYAGADFEREFRPWIERYGITDLYSSSFYPFATEEERWAYWARHIWFARFRTGALPLYRQLFDSLKDKEYFVITTNVDAQFEKAGFAAERIFATQGDYAYLQPASGHPRRLYYNEQMVAGMMAATHDCRIPSALVPHTEDGQPMAPHLRCDDTFVEDEHWHQQALRYQQFVERASESRLVMLELGVGFNTPVIIRFPFERMAAQLPQASLIRWNRDYPQLMAGGVDRYVPFTEDLAVVASAVL